MPIGTSDWSSLYLDASALVKLVLVESETEALQRFVRDRVIVSSELVIAEVPRAVARWDRSPAARGAIESLFDKVDLIPLTPQLLARAAGYDEPQLRTLDAIHVASAEEAERGVTAFVGYDRRQLKAAARVGIATKSPA